MWAARGLIALVWIAMAPPATGGVPAAKPTLVRAEAAGKGPAWALTPLADGALTGEKAATLPLASLKPAEVKLSPVNLKAAAELAALRADSRVHVLQALSGG